ncbi:hypothetical protein GCM10011403_06820 [Pseudohongiella nitratireducens]|uniref:DUF748 domain-containing protein n=1 Tax=Pseudohongiella nitratireducens TaxID=1768907 RepID=A0A917LRF0_9GAMM|nr:DUF748 domain-containing protein [Pseudohongiella nitratireducens]GGG52263.1 hypothetical protein GCM10011403_06820 [Pseudohongiella nitratireducens]
MPHIKRAARILLFCALGLLLLRAALPVALQSYVNRTLDRAEDYDGRVGNVDLSLLAGSYSIENIEIVKSNGLVQQPLFSTQQLRFSLLWSALLGGTIVGEVDLTQPVLNFVDSTAEEERQSGAGEPWLNIANDLFPLRIDHLQIRDGRVVFLNSNASPPIDVSLQDINLIALNIANSRDLAKELTTLVSATANTTGSGNLAFDVSLTPNTQLPTFDINLEASDIGLTDFENLLNYYAPFDLEAGELDLALEMASDAGELTGYMRPVLHNIDVFSWKGDVEEDGDGLFRNLAELFTGAITEIFENQASNQFATEVEFSGTLDEPDIDTFAAIAAILRNAFVDALEARIDNSINLEAD